MISKKNLVFNLVVIIAIFFYSATIQAEERSYYNYEMRVGEHISTIENYLHLFQSGKVADYDFVTNLDISKEERFLDGIRRSGEVEYDDYYVGLYREQTKIKIGLVDTEGDVSSLAADRLLGGYFSKPNYQLWFGNTIEEDGGFSSRNNLQWGMNYDVDDQSITYRSVKEKEAYNHYLSYRDGFFLRSGSLYWKINTALNNQDDIYGLKNKLSYSSRYKDIGYTIAGVYTGADFSIVESESDIGSGSYDLQLNTTKKINDLLISSDFGYRKNNINQSLEETTHDWESNWRLDYYPNSDTNYYVDLNYNLQLSYLVKDESLDHRMEKLGLELGRENENLSALLRYDLVEDNDKDEDAALEIDYFYGNYEFNGQASWSGDSGWKNELELSYGYEQKLTSKLDYESEIEFTKEESNFISLDQEFRYKLFPQQRIIVNLNLSKDFSLPGLKKLFVMRYKYTF